MLRLNLRLSRCFCANLRELIFCAKLFPTCKTEITIPALDETLRINNTIDLSTKATT